MAPTQLQVTVEAASGLQKQRGGVLASRPSSYVIIEVAGKQELRFQTPVVKHSLSPVWNFSVAIDNFDMGDTLQFTLMDSNTWPRTDKLLGKAFLTRHDICPSDCKLELALAESQANATLLVTVVTVGDVEPSEQMAKKGNLELEETHEPVEEQFGAAMEHGSVLDTGGSTELISSNCFVDMVESGEEGDGKSAITCLLPEGTGSTELSTPLLVSPESLLFRAADETQMVPALCLSPPIIYTRTVHTPVTVSSKEFARVLAGTAAMGSMELNDIALGSSPAQEKHSKVTSQAALSKSTEQVKLKKKRRGCC